MTDSYNNRLFEVFEKLIPPNVSYAVRDFDNTLTGERFSEFQLQFPLSACEYQAIQNAVPKREIEYRVGRSMAKALLGLDPFDTTTSLYRKSNGAPNWPQNIVGSISHSSSTCIVAITHKAHFSGLGIDIEHGRLEIELQPLIVGNSKTSMRLGDLTQNSALRAIFCCKEAVFKALESRLTERLDFLDVDIEYQSSSETNIYNFSVRFTRAIPCLKTFDSKYLRGRVYANDECAVSVVVAH